VAGRQDVEINAPVVLDAQLLIQADTQVLNVEDEANSVAADPTSNGSALVLREKELSALSDDPDELTQQLQAMAGPGAGPNGGQIYIDGFTGGNLPNKSSIREVRINSNPFSPEYERPGFGRIEILTKPGFDKFRGTLSFNDTDAALDSRNPFASNKPDYSVHNYDANVGGPVTRKSSFNFNWNRRDVQDNAITNAFYVDPLTYTTTHITESIVTPTSMMSFSPRFDYQLSTNHTLSVRFEDRIKALPIPRRFPSPAVYDQVFRIERNIRVQIVLDHPVRSFDQPVLAGKFRSCRRFNSSAHIRIVNLSFA